MKRIIAVSSALTLISGAALAANPTFQEVDANADGWVTPTEFAEAMPDATDSDFVAIDTNGDGAITEEEMTDYLLSQPADNG
jgi:Ca2+-binding EF-hand superfamily protein